jgi:hypothetical protein
MAMNAVAESNPNAKKSTMTDGLLKLVRPKKNYVLMLTMTARLIEPHMTRRSRHQRLRPTVNASNNKHVRELLSQYKSRKTTRRAHTIW